MDGLLARLSPILHLTRVTMAFAAVGNVWFVILWTRAHERDQMQDGIPLLTMTLTPLLVAGAVMAVGLFFFAMALNDTLDIRRDRALHPDRPLPSGRLNQETAVGLVATTLIGSVLGAAVIDRFTVFMCLLTATAILFYHAVAKFLPAIGLVSFGLIYVAHMMSPNVWLHFLWPVWLVMTHALIVGGVTYSLTRKRPALTLRMMVAAAAGWIFWSGVLLWLGHRRTGALWPPGLDLSIAVIPIILAVAFAALSIAKARSTRTPQRLADKIQRYGALWLTLYGTGWFVGAGYLNEAMILAALALVGFLGMTILREIYALIEQPVGYRR